MAYTRRPDKVLIDDVDAWIKCMEAANTDGLRSFVMARGAILARKEQLLRIAPAELALAYKLGDPFPAHFQWGVQSYELPEPKELCSIRKALKKKPEHLENFMRCTDDSTFVMLLVGLTTASKLTTHWVELQDRSPARTLQANPDAAPVDELEGANS